MASLRSDFDVDALDVRWLSHTIAGRAGDCYSIEASTNFLNWMPLGTVSNSAGSVEFTDTNAPLMLRRYYRARGL